jgi:hypothetical protein
MKYFTPHIDQQPGLATRRSQRLLIATSVFGLLYLAFIVLSFIPAQEGSPVSSAVPFRPFDLEQICVKLLFLLFLVGYFAAWKNEGVAGAIFILWYGAMWCLELFIVAPLRNNGGGIVMGLPLFILGVLFLLHWHMGRTIAAAPPAPGPALAAGRQFSERGGAP